MTSARSHAPFPPPPDIEPLEPMNPFAPIEFVRCAGGGITAKLGVMELGQVRPNAVGFKVLAYWVSFLPGGPRARPATSIEAAQRRLAEHVRDWFAACGHPLPETRKGK